MVGEDHHSVDMEGMPRFDQGGNRPQGINMFNQQPSRPFRKINGKEISAPAELAAPVVHTY